jgi:hypothetical protein
MSSKRFIWLLNRQSDLNHEFLVNLAYPLDLLDSASVGRSLTQSRKADRSPYNPYSETTESIQIVSRHR